MTQPTQATPAPILTHSIVIPNPTPRDVHLVDVEVTDANGAVNETVKSMELVGQQDRIVLEEVPGQPLRILDGKRRVMNARTLGWTTMKAEVFPPLTQEQRAHLKIGLHRRAPNVVDESRALKDLAASHRIVLTDADAAEQLARISGLKVGQVRRYLKIMNLPDDVLELVGTTVSEGVAASVANLHGPHRDDAIHQIRTAAADGEARFTGQDLKNIQLARTTSMGEVLGGAPMPNVFSINPVQALASDVRIMCSERNVSIDDLIQELSTGTPPTHVDPFEAAFGVVTPVPQAAPTMTPQAAPVLASTASPWDMDGSSAPTPSSTPTPSSAPVTPNGNQGHTVLAAPEYLQAMFPGDMTVDQDEQTDVVEAEEVVETAPEVEATPVSDAEQEAQDEARTEAEDEARAEAELATPGALDLDALFGQGGETQPSRAALPEEAFTGNAGALDLDALFGQGNVTPEADADVLGPVNLDALFGMGDDSTETSAAQEPEASAAPVQPAQEPEPEATPTPTAPRAPAPFMPGAPRPAGTPGGRTRPGIR